MPLSRNQVDQAGRRIRIAARNGLDLEERDLQILRLFRDERRAALLDLHACVEALQSSLREQLTWAAGVKGWQVASRPKTEEAIVAKLRRSDTSLWRMQDIIGARLVVPPSLQIQDVAIDVFVELAEGLNARPRVKDTRETGDDLGYRAVHVVLDWHERPAEVQLRTRPQQLWAQLVERLDTAQGTDLKHGDGPADQLDWLITLSQQLRNADLGRPYDIPELPL